MGAIAAGVRRVAATSLSRVGVGLIVIDYVQLVQIASRSSRYETVTEVSIALKAMAMQMGVPIVVLAQLNRGAEQREDKRPMLSDLKESGQLEQDADAVILCYRHEYYIEREEPEDPLSEDHAEWREAMEGCKHRLELIIAKQRQGPIGTARVRFNPALNHIWEA